jgi:DNA-damage-inducible protein J
MEMLMAVKLVTFKMEERIKKEFDFFCSEVGISASNAFNMFARTVVREQRIPFEITVDPFYSETNIQALKRSAKQADDGLFPEQSTAEDFDALMARL